MSLPLVSCIMPTKNRREFVPQAVEYFLRQTYPNKQLVIGTDFLDSARGPSVRPDGVWEVVCRDGITLGTKRNALIGVARGPLIAHWDDDDWYGPTRLADQVSVLQSNAADVCGIDAPLFYDLRTGKAYRYHYADGCPYGATLMYTRKFWEARPFADVQVGETDPFMQGRWPAPSVAGSWYVGMIHDGNTCPKALQSRYFTPYPDLVCPGLIADWPFYRGLREKMGVAA